MRERLGPHPYESLRLYGIVRGAIITYGIGAFALFGWPFTDGEPGAVSGPRGMLLAGLLLQALIVGGSVVARRRSPAAATTRPDESIGGLLFQLVADGVTVLLFAVATFKRIYSAVDAALPRGPTCARGFARAGRRADIRESSSGRRTPAA